MITAAAVKELREMTGCGMMDCKKALAEANGDMDKAIEWLREKGLAAATKKAGRIAAEGLVYAETFGDKGVVIEVNSETDFVAKNEDFKTFVKTLAAIVAENNPADVDALKALSYTGSDLNVEEMLREKILTIGENMNIRRFARYEGGVVTYIHGEGRIGVMVKVEADLSNAAAVEAAKDAAMQIAAMNPMYMDKSVVPAADVEHEKGIILAQIKEDPKNASKPEAILEKMVEGKINKFFEENCLLQQKFVKDDKTSVEKYLAANGVKLVDMVRFEKGDGLEKREDDFAAEVEKMAGK